MIFITLIVFCSYQIRFLKSYLFFKKKSKFNDLHQHEGNYRVPVKVVALYDKSNEKLFVSSDSRMILQR